MSRIGADLSHDRHNDKTHQHACRSEHRQASATPETVHAKECEEGCNAELRGAARAEQASGMFGVAKFPPKHYRKVLDKQVDTRKLL